MEVTARYILFLNTFYTRTYAICLHPVPPSDVLYRTSFFCFSEEIVLAALGPLTNLALSIRLDPNFTSNLSDIYIMGGNTTGKRMA